MRIVATTKYGYLAGALNNEDFPGIKVETTTFPDGEVYHRLNPDHILNEDVCLIGGTHDDSSTLELFDMACAIVKLGANSLIIVIPWYGYATMEREVKSGEIVKAKTRATLLSAIPRAKGKNTIMFIDLHSEGIPYYFNEDNVNTVHIYAKDLVMKMCKMAALNKADPDFVLGSTDAGRAKWIESLSNDMGVDCALITKRRTSGTETKVTSVNADVCGRVVVIYDDMIRTGGSLISAAKVYKDNGAVAVFAVATHGVFPGNSLLKLKQSGLIDKIYVTDTHPRSYQLKDEMRDFLDVHRVSDLILSRLLAQIPFVV